MHFRFCLLPSSLPRRDYYQSLRLAYFRFPLSFRDIEEMLPVRGATLRFPKINGRLITSGAR